MKHFYVLVLLCSTFFTAFAQSVTVNATGATGSYKTGTIRNWTVPTRNDGDLEVKFNGSSSASNGVRRGWAVFDLNGVVPAGATVTGVSLRFTISSLATTGIPPVAITGYAGDLSTITDPATVYAGCYSGTAFNTTAWGAATGTLTRPFNSTGIDFINTEAAANNVISIGFTPTGVPTTQIYTITGVGGSTATQPQLQISYTCTGMAGVSAGATPNPVCVGTSFSLTGTATGATDYLWSGPGGFTSTEQNPPAFAASVPGTATYTFTAYSSAGCPISNAVDVSVFSPVVPAIAGYSSVCIGSSITLTNDSSGGVWSSSNATVATINAAGVVTGIAQGISDISYTITNVCGTYSAVKSVAANSAAVINTVSPLSGNPGSPVTLTGSSFDIGLTENSVYFGATKATITSASASSLTASLPLGGTYDFVRVGNRSCNSVALSKLNFLPSFDNSIFDTTIRYRTKVDFIGTLSVYSVMIADVDGDGKPDIVTSDNLRNMVSVYHNLTTTGTITGASFANKVDFHGGGMGITLADIDGDGKQDIISPNYYSASVAIFRNTSIPGVIDASTLADTANFATQGNPSAVSVADIDGDGKLDVIVTNAYSSTMSVLRNMSLSGNVSLATQVVFNTVDASTVATGDIDGDNKPDIVVSGSGTSEVSIYRNIATVGITTLSFEPRVDIPTFGLKSIKLADMDGDGKLDIVGLTSLPRIYRNISTYGVINTSSFASYVGFGIASGTGVRLSIGDVTGDGKPDIVSSVLGTNKVSIYKNTSIAGTINSGSFASNVDFSTGIDPYGVAVGDLNGDGKPEIAVANLTSATMSILENFPLLESSITGSSTLCIGVSAPYSHANTGGTWSVSNPLVATINPVSGVLTGLTAGVEIVSYSVSGGFDTMTVNVTSGSLPSAGSISGTASVCMGSAITLTNATTGGIWSSSNVATASVSGGLVTGISFGTAIISYTVTNVCGSATDTALITVHPIPSDVTIATSSTTLCPGTPGDVTFTGTPGTVVRYTEVLSDEVGMTVYDTLTTVLDGSGTATVPVTTTRPGLTGSILFTYTILDATMGACVYDYPSSANTTFNTEILNGWLTGVSGTGVYTVPSDGAQHTFMCRGNTGVIHLITHPDATVVIKLHDAAAGTETYDTVTASFMGYYDINTLPIYDTLIYTIVGISYGGCSVFEMTLGVDNFSLLPLPQGTITSKYVENTLGAWMPVDSANTHVCVGSEQNVDLLFNIEELNVVSGFTTTPTLTYHINGGSDTTVPIDFYPSRVQINTGVLTGNTTIYFTGIADNAGCTTVISDSISFIVNPAVVVTVSGASSVCAGSTITLTADSTGGSWTSDNTAVAAVDVTTGAVGGLGAGAAIISYTYAGSCGTTVDTQMITVNPLPDAGVLSGADTICSGTSTSIVSTVPGGAWSITGLSATIDASGNVTGTSEGDNIVVYISSTLSCGQDTAWHPIFVKAPPVAGTITGTTTGVWVHRSH